MSIVVKILLSNILLGFISAGIKQECSMSKSDENIKKIATTIEGISLIGVIVSVFVIIWLW